jgi:hypothetical protein
MIFKSSKSILIFHKKTLDFNPRVAGSNPVQNVLYNDTLNKSYIKSIVIIFEQVLQI